MEQQERLHEASIKSLCADFETAYVENDKMAERIGGLEDVVDVQQERLESAEKHLSTAKSKCLRMQYGKKKLLYTEDRLQVAREEIEHLRAYVNLDNLDTSFEAQVNTTDDAQLNSAVQETINTVAALAKKLLTLRGQLSS